MAHRSFPTVGPDLDDLDDLDAPALGRMPTAPWAASLAHVPPVPPRLLALGATVVAVALGWWLLRPVPSPIEAAVPVAASASDRPPAGGGAPAAEAAASATGGTGASSTTTVVELVVQAAGAVVAPGVYRLPPDARVDDLIDAAGGFATGADPDRVNLAAPLADGERIWVPTTEDEAAPTVIAGGGATGGGSGGSSPQHLSAEAGPGADGLVDINTATEAELESLPGVGPATAGAILAHRDQVGGFRSVDELIDVRGIGEAKLEQMRPLVRV